MSKSAYLLLAFCSLVILASCDLFKTGVGEKDKPVVPDQVKEEAQPLDKTDEQSDPCDELRGDKQDRCYQNIAWEKGDPSLCERVRGDRFAHLESNPAVDKCYFMVAVKLCSPWICDEIGGEEGLSPTSCKQKISQECP